VTAVRQGKSRLYIVGEGFAQTPRDQEGKGGIRQAIEVQGENLSSSGSARTFIRQTQGGAARLKVAKYIGSLLM